MTVYSRIRSNISATGQYPNGLKIGSSSLSSLLDVYGDVSVTGMTNISNLTSSGKFSVFHTASSGTSLGYSTHAFSTSSNSTSVYAGNSKTAMAISSTGTWTNAGATATNIGLVVTASGGSINYAGLFMGGNVGIGNYTPMSTLEVSGNWKLGTIENPSAQSASNYWGGLGGQPFGYVANMFYYNRKLSLSEISQMYDYLSPRFI